MSRTFYQYANGTVRKSEKILFEFPWLFMLSQNWDFNTFSFNVVRINWLPENHSIFKNLHIKVGELKAERLRVQKLNDVELKIETEIHNNIVKIFYLRVATFFELIDCCDKNYDLTENFDESIDAITEVTYCGHLGIPTSITIYLPPKKKTFSDYLNWFHNPLDK